MGGELCRACFRHGFAARGWRLFREFWEQVKSDNGALVTWYTLDGRAAANTGWTTNYDAWGIGAWGRAAIEGFVGVQPLAPAMERCQCAPQWASGEIRQARACIAMPASRGYFAYDYTCDESGLRLRFTGSGETVDFDIPVDAIPQGHEVTLDGIPVAGSRETKDGVEYLCVSTKVDGIRTLQSGP